MTRLQWGILIVVSAVITLACAGALFFTSVNTTLFGESSSVTGPKVVTTIAAPLTPLPTLSAPPVPLSSSTSSSLAPLAPSTSSSSTTTRRTTTTSTTSTVPPPMPPGTALPIVPPSIDVPPVPSVVPATTVVTPPTVPELPTTTIAPPVYADCAAVLVARAEALANGREFPFPLRPGDHGWRVELDLDGDGEACEDELLPPAETTSSSTTSTTAVEPEDGDGR